MDEISNFQQLLAAAAAQREPQRLMFVFASAELPDDATTAQRERFQAGRGGALAPLMCVDKAPGDLSDFNTLVTESRAAGPPWQVVFAASLSGRDQQPPTKAEIELALQSMVLAVQRGGGGRYCAFGPDGEPIHIH